MRKVIARIKGGLGNQLFCYAAARRLAIVNDAELVLDNVSGFSRDSKYRRKFQLDGFNITARLAKPSERFEPLERIRRGLVKFNERRKPFMQRKYIEEEVVGFDERILGIKLLESVVVIDGLWQSAKYFCDVEDSLRCDLSIKPHNDIKNLDALEWIKKNRATAIHVRWFGHAGSDENIPYSYYRSAILKIKQRISDPYFAIFSDYPDKAIEVLGLPQNRLLKADWNMRDGGELADMWLMSHCAHSIMSNSTFSWWGTWLGSKCENRLVFFPRSKAAGEIPSWSRAWDYEGQMLGNWLPILV